MSKCRNVTDGQGGTHKLPIARCRHPCKCNAQLCTKQKSKCQGGLGEVPVTSDPASKFSHSLPAVLPRPVSPRLASSLSSAGGLSLRGIAGAGGVSRMRSHCPAVLGFFSRSTARCALTHAHGLAGALTRPLAARAPGPPRPVPPLPPSRAPARRLPPPPPPELCSMASRRMETKPVITCLKTLLIIYSFVFWVSTHAGPVAESLSICPYDDALRKEVGRKTQTKNQISDPSLRRQARGAGSGMQDGSRVRVGAAGTLDLAPRRLQGAA